MARRFCFDLNYLLSYLIYLGLVLTSSLLASHAGTVSMIENLSAPISMPENPVVQPAAESELATATTVRSNWDPIAMYQREPDTLAAIIMIVVVGAVIGRRVLEYFAIIERAAEAKLRGGTQRHSRRELPSAVASGSLPSSAAYRGAMAGQAT